MYIVFFLTLSSIKFHHKWLDIILCATEQNLIAYRSKCNSLYLLAPNSQSIPLLPPPPWQPQFCSPCPWVCIFSVDRYICAIYHSPYTRDIIWYLSFSFRLTSLIWESLVLSILLQWHDFVLFYGWVVLHWVYVLHLLNPFICWCVFRLFPCLGCCE